MFTGLIEAIGRIAGIAPTAEGIRLGVSTPLAAELRTGDSVSVNGVCLTAAAVRGGAFEADVGPETNRVTTLGSLRRGAPVNLERAMAAGGRFGGHLVQGHVDGVARLVAVREVSDARWLTVAFDPALAPYLIPKGSIAVDGVSLTVAALREAEFDVMIVPMTWDRTNLHVRAAGDLVNLECDVIGKYVARAAQLGLAEVVRLDPNPPRGQPDLTRR